MTPLDDRDMARLLGEIEGRLTGMEERDRRIETIILGWEHRCLACTERIERRLRRCEDAQLRIGAVASFMGLMAALLPGWLRGIWR